MNCATRSFRICSPVATFTSRKLDLKFTTRTQLSMETLIAIFSSLLLLQYIILTQKVETIHSKMAPIPSLTLNDGNKIPVVCSTYFPIATMQRTDTS